MVFLLQTSWRKTCWSTLSVPLFTQCQTCTCAERRCHKNRRTLKASVSIKGNCPLACSGRSPRDSPLFSKYRLFRRLLHGKEWVVFSSSKNVLMGSWLHLLIAGWLLVGCWFLLLQLGKGGLKLLDQNMFFEPAKEAKTIRRVANQS